MVLVSFSSVLLDNIFLTTPLAQTSLVQGNHDSVDIGSNLPTERSLGELKVIMRNTSVSLGIGFTICISVLFTNDDKVYY